MNLSRLSVALTFAVASALPLTSFGGPELTVIDLSRDHMIDHPAGGHYVLWNGPASLDVGLPTGGFVRFAVANLTPQWAMLLDAQGRPLPVAARYGGRGLAILWLPYDGPVPTRGKLSDDDYRKVLDNISKLRQEGLMNSAKGIRGSR